MSKAIFYDVSPLVELHYTGIANVTAALASALLNNHDVDVHFMMGLHLITPEAVQLAIEIQSGAVLRLDIENGTALNGFTRVIAGNYDRTVAIFPNVKTLTGCFTDEVQIIHDITFIITPEFHHVDTINYHAGTLISDLSGNSFTFADSDSTRSDLIEYFNLPSDSIETAYPGVNTSDNGMIELEKIDASDPLLGRRYVIVPGTIEPRKNGKLILKYLSRNEEFLNSYTLVFFGRRGWMVDFKNLIDSYGLAKHLEEKRIIWLDYISNGARDELYRNADFVIYPSLYEGFGLPVGEAMAQGCPVCASFSSSIPEVGGDAAIYFDPLSVEDLTHAIEKMRKNLTTSKSAMASLAKEQARKFTWELFTNKVLFKAKELLGA